MQKSVAGQTEDCHVQAPDAGLGARIKSLAWHLFQMIIAMEIGMMLYRVVFVNLLAPTSYKAFILANPLFDYWMMMVAMTLPMIVLMRRHKYDWHYCAGMTVAMLAPVVMLTMFVLVGLIPLMILNGAGMALMILGMALYMFLCRD